ncbi:MAG: LON peptidase substrate-binding domain-containing protein, partial [Anaerolineae bacterium]|nr:LON peptidase substrate-binding domain-containing protein [Anaerolineae bacterium]
MDWDKLPLAPEDLFGDPDDYMQENEGPFEAIILPLRDLVMYPQMVTPLYVGREPSLQALDIAVREDWPLITVAQKDDSQDEYPTGDELYEVGTEIVVARSIRLPDGTTSAIAQGLSRIRILEYTQQAPYLIATVEVIDEEIEDNSLSEALMRVVLSMLETVVQLNQTLPDEAYVYAMNVKSPGELADVIAQIIDLSSVIRQELLETINTTHRLQKVNSHLAHELDVLKLENQIQTSVQEEVDKTQREYFLREQLRAIQRELGESDAFTRDLGKLRQLLDENQFPDYARTRAEEELDRLSTMPSMAPEVGIIRTYLDWLLHLP